MTRHFDLSQQYSQSKSVCVSHKIGMSIDTAQAKTQDSLSIKESLYLLKRRFH